MRSWNIDTAPSRRELVAATVVAVAGFLALAAPWVLDAARAIPDAARAGSPGFGADARLNVWTLAWDTHALLTQPGRLFDANIFHPASGMLAGSEHLLASTIVAGPIYVVSGNPLLAANVAAMATYVLAAVAAYALLRRLGLPGAPSAGGALAFALGPLRVPADLHVLNYPNYVLPLLVLAVGAAVRSRSRRGTLWVVVASLLAAFSSYYVAAMAAVLLGVEVLLVAASVGWRAAARVTIGATAAFALLGVFSITYVRLARTLPPHDLEVAFDWVARYAQARLLNPADPEMGVGWGVAVLAAVGLVLPLLRRRAPGVRWWRWVLVTLAGLVLAWGPHLQVGAFAVPLPYAFLMHTPLAALRAFPRFFILAHVGIVGLAAEGAAAMLAAAARIVGGGRVASAAVTGAIVFAMAVPRVGGLNELPRSVEPLGEAVPPVYRWLAANAEGPLLELPGPPRNLLDPAKLLEQSRIMYRSTFHWLPLLNGHTGFRPWWLRGLALEIERLPEPHALQAVIDMTGLRWILARPSRLTPLQLAAWSGLPFRDSGLIRVAGGDPDLLFYVKRPPRRPWAEALGRGVPRPGHSALGTPLAPLDAATTRGRVRALKAWIWARPGASVAMTVEVTNDGATDWPALLPPWMSDTGLVVVRGRFIPAEGGAETGEAHARLPRDLLPGDRVGVLWQGSAPTSPGAYRLVLGLAQVDAPPLSRADVADVMVDVHPPLTPGPTSP